MREEIKLKRLIFVKRIILVTLILYIAVFFVWKFSTLSVDGLKRSLYDVKSAFSGTVTVSDTVELTKNDNSFSEAFRDGFVYVTPTLCSVYGSNGVKYSTFKVSLASPAVRCGEREFILFDRGGKSIYLCNSFGIEIKYDSEESVVNAGISDNGNIFVIKGKYGYKSELCVYNNNFDENNYFYWDSSNVYLTDAAFSSNGRIAVTGLSQMDNGFDTVLYDIDYKKGEQIASYTFENQIAAAVGKNSDAAVTVLTDSSVIRMSDDGAEVVYSFNGLNADVFFVGSHGTVLSLIKQVSTRSEDVSLLDGDGNIRFTQTVTGVCDVAVVRDTVYILADGIICAYDSFGNKIAEKSVPDTFEICANEEAVICIGNNKAISVEF